MELNWNWNLSHEKKVGSPAFRKTASRSPDFELQKSQRVFRSNGLHESYKICKTMLLSSTPSSLILTRKHAE